MLDRELGHELIGNAKEFNAIMQLGMEIIYVLVSSSEESDVLKKYEEKGVKHFVKKPLNKIQLEKTKEYVNS